MVFKLSKDEIDLLKTATTDPIAETLENWSGSIRKVWIDMVDKALNSPEEFKATYGENWADNITGAVDFSQLIAHLDAREQLPHMN